MFPGEISVKTPKEEMMKITGVLMSVMLVLGCMVVGQCFAQEDQADIMLLNAEVVSIDPEEGVLVVAGTEGSGELEGKEITVNVSGETVMLLEDEEIELYDIMTGDDLIIEHYTNDDGNVVATKIHLTFDMMEIDETEIDIE